MSPCQPNSWICSLQDDLQPKQPTVNQLQHLVVSREHLPQGGSAQLPLPTSHGLPPQADVPVSSDAPTSAPFW